MENNKPTCFVIQEYDDGGPFDKRYQETIEPALVAAEVEPLRADKILGLQPIIEKIETAIQQASICVAEVSTDNPNVWLELGYALAINRPVVILCDKQLRSKLPFDVQHRPVIFYRTDSDYEVAILTTILALWPTSSSGAGHWELEKKLKSIGYSSAALGLGISKLMDKGLIQQNSETDMNGNDYFLYRVSPEGISWLQAREDQINLVLPSRHATPAADFDDDIPF